jgi:hypothetical protein
MRLTIQELADIARELLANPGMSLQEALNSVGLDDLEAQDLSAETLEDLHELAVQCACGYWRRPDEVNAEGVCHAGCPK